VGYPEDTLSGALANAPEANVATGLNRHLSHWEEMEYTNCQPFTVANLLKFNYLVVQNTPIQRVGQKSPSFNAVKTHEFCPEA
jgi:hypothetical protein